MEIQIPSVALNEFLRSPGGGHSIGELSEILQPVIDLRESIYPRSSINLGLATLAGAANLLSLPSGLGFYRVRGNFTARIVNGVNAGQFQYLLSSNGNSIGQIDLIDAQIAAAATFNVLLTEFDQILDFSNPLDLPGTLAISFAGSQPAAVTTVSFSLFATAQRIS